MMWGNVGCRGIMWGTVVYHVTMRSNMGYRGVAWDTPWDTPWDAMWGTTWDMWKL